MQVSELSPITKQENMNIQIKLSLAVFLLIVTALITSCGPGEQPQVKAIKGQLAPNFMLTDIKGKDWQLSDLRDKVVFINFWATWCPPCIQELPSMEDLNKHMAGKPFQMLTILYNDRPEFGQSLVNKSGYTFPVLIDSDSFTAKEYGLTGVPETYIVDTQGILREKFIGPFECNSPEALQIIGKYLPQ